MGKFTEELKKTFRSLGNATTSTLSKLDSPEMKKLDEDMKKAMNGVE